MIVSLSVGVWTGRCCEDIGMGAWIALVVVYTHRLCKAAERCCFTPLSLLLLLVVRKQFCT